MTITSEDALNSRISDEIASESITDAIASAREIVISVEDESAINKEPGPPDEGGIPCETPAPPEPGPDEPDSGEEK
jgi:hypothetical protein